MSCNIFLHVQLLCNTNMFYFSWKNVKQVQLRGLVVRLHSNGNISSSFYTSLSNGNGNTAICWRMVWVCLTIFWGWHLNGYSKDGCACWWFYSQENHQWPEPLLGYSLYIRPGIWLIPTDNKVMLDNHRRFQQKTRWCLQRFER